MDILALESLHPLKRRAVDAHMLKHGGRFIERRHAPGVPTTFHMHTEREGVLQCYFPEPAGGGIGEFSMSPPAPA
jgi:hypothetical protein